MPTAVNARRSIHAETMELQDNRYITKARPLAITQSCLPFDP